MTKGVWVFHRGALGDSVLTWPMMRGLHQRSAQVTFVADSAKARLAAAALGIEGLDAEQRRFSELWAEGARPVAMHGAARVVSFVADETTAAGRVWLAGARAMFPGAAVECIPGPIDRTTALSLAGERSMPPARTNAGGPIVLHVGAGSEAKRWPMDRWVALAARLTTQLGARPIVIAGEAETERFGARERAAFTTLDGRYLTDLAELARIVGSASVFIGGDTGPTHLAAQLGVATLALFGPTDPHRWAPIGPRVAVAAPPRPAPMEWLSTTDVLSLVGRF